MSVFTVICGGLKCNANCPFCISKMTQAYKRGAHGDDFDWIRFQKAMRLAERNGVDTALITGFGEPTLCDDLLKIVTEVHNFFPHIELQTNGIKALDPEYETYWRILKNSGLDTVAVSCVSLNEKINNKVMRISEAFSIRQAILKLVEFGFTVRVSMQLTYFISYLEDDIESIIYDAKRLCAKQITFRIVGTPKHTHDQKALDWIKEFAPDAKDVSRRMLGIMESIEAEQWGKYHWGGRLYDVYGISVCVADCLTELPEEEIPRSYIFDGKNLRYSWQYEGSVIF